MEKQSTKTGSLLFRKRMLWVGGTFFWAPMAWLVYVGDWRLAVCLFLMIVGNNICMRKR